MKKLTPTQATKKLVKMVNKPGFTENMAYGYVETFLDVEFNNERNYVTEFQMDNLLDLAGQAGW